MKDWGGCKQLLQQILWNIYASLKEQDYNCFPQINTVPFKFSDSHTLLTIMDDCNKFCERNTAPLT